MNKKLLGLALVATFSMGSAQAILIDNFDDGAQLVDAPGTDITAISGIGGYRTVDIVKTGSLGASAAVITPPGIFSHSADALTSATSTITWNANGAGLGGMDLIEGLINNVFSFDILSIDQGDIDLILSVEDTLGGADSFTFSGAGAGTESVAFSSFAGIDFTSVDLISLQIVGGIASDLTLDSLETTGDLAPIAPPVTVPEPASLALMAGGLLALRLGRRKAK